MTEIRWLNKQALILLHSETISLHGGLDGIRDEGLLDSALARPQNIHAYENETDVTRLAAAYGIGIARNHPFLDGNKRAAFLAIGLFLRLNGFRLVANPVEATQVMLKVATGETTESDLISWIKNNISETSS
ncbi:type II toxin-antitoxin system death-on-curing family toxin [Crocosphaera sp. XPORK-15E]|uniref:type II toxin-antitoxin system death-on-curing family toxin n=1 Tax=Crocosphaera sp. XPORK-15E TaxID=3110247 RepID=UPI002B1F98F4|nr:type II toxin-antitoxin system death-on-curing family toxin [Crocosphaera sp. XPORK-15E]MEA5536858.1 type II toxin-antitoxin system death-on-curing family toxin [Crocosphaera sp. XPORK-15E]